MNRMLRLLGLDLAGRRFEGLHAALAYGAATALFEAIPYGVLVWALHSVLTGITEPWQAPASAGLLLIAFFGAWFCKAQALLKSFSATYCMVAEMRLAAADRLGRMSLGRIQRGRGATLADLFTDRFTLYQDIVTHMWWQVSSTLGFPVVIWIMLMLVDWRIGTVIALFIPLALWVVPWSFRLLDRATDKVIPARNDLANRIVELVEGIKDVQLMDAEGVRADAARRSVRTLEERALATELAPSPAILAFGFVWSLAVSAAIVIGAWMYLDGTTSVFALAASLVLSARLCASLSDLGIFLIEFRFARRALMSIREFVDQPLLPAAASPLEPQGAGIDIDHVSFSHDDEQTLSDVSLALPAGGILALVGPSGSGKSTLAGLIARLWDVDAGAIRIGGVDLRNMSPDVLNATVSMVLQEVSLFEMPVKENIRLGRPGASDAEVEASARAARIHDRILDMPQGYDTILQGGGVALSGGERQRIAIARALLKDAPVLVLDEASASVDLENEWLIQDALDELTRGRTVIVIAHRLWTVAGADRIAFMRDGCVTETGSHDELIARNGDYASLWKQQAQARGWRGRASVDQTLIL
ncbi:MAG: ABC transporter ATP-binding protein/permease [Rhizobiaceae bacterium]|nr:ABC transporter ATP-binding protein/permease [Rhizobiaceae bacterium]